MSLEIAEQALRAAASPDPETRHGRFARFMREVEDRATKVSAVLSKYEGWTWKAALDGHSVENPPSR